MLIAALVKKDITVCLTGDGGDELFCGYYHYAWASQINNKLGNIPYSLRALFAQIIKTVPPSLWSALPERLIPWMSSFPRKTQLGDALHKLAEIIDFKSEEDIYLKLISLWKQPMKVIVGLDRDEHNNERHFAMSGVIAVCLVICRLWKK